MTKLICILSLLSIQRLLLWRKKPKIFMCEPTLQSKKEGKLPFATCLQMKRSWFMSTMGRIENCGEVNLPIWNWRYDGEGMDGRTPELVTSFPCHQLSSVWPCGFNLKPFTSSNSPISSSSRGSIACYAASLEHVVDMRGNEEEMTVVAMKEGKIWHYFCSGHVWV